MANRYPNGSVPFYALRLYRFGWLSAAAKADVKQVVRRAALAGHSVRVINRWSMYRSRRLQKAMRAHPGRYAVGINPRTGKFIVQAPVGGSTHGWGDAVDLMASNQAGWDWLVRNSHHWRLTRPNPKGDPHHFRHG